MLYQPLLCWYGHDAKNNLNTYRWYHLPHPENSAKPVISGFQRLNHTKTKPIPLVNQTYPNFLHLHSNRTTLTSMKSFFSLLFLVEQRPLFVFILLCRPSEDSLQWSTIPEGSPSKGWQSTVGWGDCRIRTRDCRFTVWCQYQWATTAPLMSHHCSLVPPLRAVVAHIHEICGQAPLNYFSEVSSVVHF